MDNFPSNNIGNVNNGGNQINGNNNMFHFNDDKPSHEARVRSQHELPISERFSLLFSIAASIATIASAKVAIRPAFAAMDSFSLVSFAEVSTKWMLLFMISALLSLLGWNFRYWMRRRTLGPTVLGITPLGRRGNDGKVRLNMVRLTGICAIDGSKMHSRSVETAWKTSIVNGVEKRRVTKRENYLVCMRNPKDANHHGKIDATLLG